MCKPIRSGMTPYAEVWDKVRKRPERRHLVGVLGSRESAYNTASRLRNRDRALLNQKPAIEVWVEGTNLYARVA